MVCGDDICTGESSTAGHKYRGGTFALSTLVAWRWTGIGGTILVLEGVAALGFIVRAFLQGSFNTSTLILMCLTLGFPPLAAGILFLIHWKKSR
jgi:hypothetical protein